MTAFGLIMKTENLSR